MKPLSRFYHFINSVAFLWIWLISNFFIAAYHDLFGRTDSINFGIALLISLTSSVLGSLAIFLTIKMFYSIYVKNIVNAFRESKMMSPPNFHPKYKINKKKVVVATEHKSKLSKNSTLDDLELETKKSSKKNKDHSLKNSNDGMHETARNLLSDELSSIHGEGNQSILTEGDVVVYRDLNFKGDTNLISAESTKGINLWNGILFLSVLILASLFTAFCCIYTYHHFKTGLIFISLFTIIFALIIEFLIMRPIGVLFLTIYIFLRRKFRKDYSLVVNRELNASLLSSQDNLSPRDLKPDPEDPEKHEEESKIETLKETAPKRLPTNIDELKEKRMNTLNKYNIQLLEDIYNAYDDPEEADKVIKVFRKGGIFSVEPIQEEELEYSLDQDDYDPENEPLMQKDGEKGNTREEDILDDQGNVIGKRIFDENGVLIEEHYFDEDGNVVSKKIFDKKGNVVEE